MSTPAALIEALDEIGGALRAGELVRALEPLQRLETIRQVLERQGTALEPRQCAEARRLLAENDALLASLGAALAEQVNSLGASRRALGRYKAVDRGVR